MPSLIGDANDIGGDCFEITENLNTQSGAVWSGTPVDMNNDFVIEFRGFFGTNDANGADGIVFILKNSVTPEIGNLGGGMGYEGINNSLAVEFDTWQNNDLGDPFFDHLAIISTGVNNHNAATNLAGPVQASATSVNIEDGAEHIIRIEWTVATNTLDVYFDCDLRLSYSGDIVNTIFSGVTDAYFGFTGSTGGAANLQRVCFDYVSFANSLSLDDQNICPGSVVNSIDATVTGATTYAWTPTTGVSDPSIANPVFTPTATTIYTVSITNSCSEIIQESFTITIDPLPVANTINDFSICDDDSNDGINAFDFTNLDATVLGVLDPMLFSVSYHASQMDADDNTNALTFPYTNTAQCEQIYVRVENDANPTCYNTTNFEVCVNTQPIANQPNNMMACDIGNDGAEIYNLSLQESNIFGMQNATDFNISFHDSQADANSDINPLPTMYSGIDGEIIFVRIESAEVGNDCFATTTFQLILNEIPVASTIADFRVCDDVSNDGINAFDFTNLNTTALGTLDPMLFSVSYHTSQMDADDNTNALTFPYTNTAQCEQIYVRIENDANPVCYDTTNFEVCLDSQPIANQPDNIVVCDFDNNGSEVFDLSMQLSDILGAQNTVNFNITFHANLTDADDNMNALATMHNGANGETIYVRIESTLAGNECYDTTTFDLLFDIPPIVTMPTDLIVCDDEVSDGFTEIDLNVKSAEIVNNQPGFSVQYYLTQVDADNDVNPLIIPYTNISNPQTIFVRVESGNSGCYVTTSLVISVEDAPAVFPATPLEYCDTDNDGFGIFDIRSTESQVTGGITTNIVVTYHETPEDADNNVNVLDDTYTNINAYNQTIYVRVENVLTG
ncbi:L-type lectin-domain containing protein, partial [uncultured Kordia sp.]|uniref:L-type lectin-domain containing protein n=1 Tax=uncultured Kordia sp. TaxID=507699 RepID=UPI0026290A26